MNRVVFKSITAESNGAITIAMNCDWLKDFVLDSHPVRGKTKGSQTLYV